ncbi:nickel pincer cofactor biosynthesis protein LarC [Desulfobacterales bacterium HSG16]|nr:nickel pincer cofactor biosynthesis protein LarC [Desulfobacterales bacterium HSG16]
MLVYFDCFSGISGDMVLGAFVDLGVPVDYLVKALESIPLKGFDIKVDSISRMGICAKQVRVITDEHARHRTYADIRQLIGKSALPNKVKEKSLDIFFRIAKAEADIHGCSIDNVHFHELGGIDAIVDVVGACLCVDYLKIAKMYSSKIPLGFGFTSCMHGRLPVPVPATLAILKGVPVYGTDICCELVTPTGAGIIASFAASFGPMPDMLTEDMGYGAGERDLSEQPNLLRVITGKESELADGSSDEKIWVIETCIDDMNPEIFGYLMDRLFQDGVLDVYWIPVHMKKNRPGIMVRAICRDEARETVINRIFKETTSLGIRYEKVSRRVLARENIEINCEYGMVRAKKVKHGKGEIRIMPEFEECKKIALEKNISIGQVYRTILKNI